MARRFFTTVVLGITLLTREASAYGFSAGSLIWRRSDKIFVPIETISTFQAERQHYLKKSRESETHNFGKEVLKVAYYQESNIFDFYDNDTKVTGVCGELWNILAEHLNFTMVTTRTKDTTFGALLPNGSYNGLLGMLTRDEIQIIPRSGFYVLESRAMAYTTPVWYNSYRLYIKPEWRANSAWIVHMFSRKVWCSLLLLLILLSVFGYAIQRTSMTVAGDKHRYHNLHDHFFYTFGTFCCQGFIPDSLYRRTKILGFSKKMFAYLLLMTISSHLISWTTNQKVYPPFHDFGSMFNSTTYDIVIFTGSIIYEKYKKTIKDLGYERRYKNRETHVGSPQDLYHKGCWGRKKYAILDSEDRQRAYGRFQCDLVGTGEAYFSTWVTAGVSKTFKYKRTLDMGILKMNEAGLTDGLKDRWMATSITDTNPNVVTSLTFHQVSMLFAILSIGMIVSIVIFIFENIVYLYYQRKRRKMKARKTVHIRGKIFL
ncbi:glutamate receptor ionotropic, NMDA 1-like [Venturia canescens]|uniref:glutamate receptor ionotropic, NMDA 1-like n=1 Tax=Venturia canescens TaxID=32260 RepID=UPI001C9BDF74|nr:glutamate receptor ionotropic, NMDA 1-like [Venturia canescens]